MDKKLVEQLRTITRARRSMAEARRAEAQRGIRDGTALAETYAGLDCGVGFAAELSVGHVARSLEVIARGIAALRVAEAGAAAEAVRLGVADERLSEILRAVREEAIREDEARALAEVLDGAALANKSGASLD